MATSTLIPLAEYLSASDRPDCDYVDGELGERNVGESDHSTRKGLNILMTGQLLVEGTEIFLPWAEVFSALE